MGRVGMIYCFCIAPRPKLGPAVRIRETSKGARGLSPAFSAPLPVTIRAHAVTKRRSLRSLGLIIATSRNHVLGQKDRGTGGQWKSVGGALAALLKQTWTGTADATFAGQTQSIGSCRALRESTRLSRGRPRRNLSGVFRSTICA